VPEGPFQLRRWGWPVTVIAVAYLGVMLVNIAAPTGLTSPRGALFNLDWVTVTVMVLIAVVGGLVRLVSGSRPVAGSVPGGEAGLPSQRGAGDDSSVRAD
jgi:hypothetical protein